jgi:hypothetical protein
MSGATQPVQPDVTRTASLSRRERAGSLGLFALLVGVIGYATFTAAYPAVFFPWYYNTEEFPYVQEILRFVELDFRQEFFDIPGTPLMMLGTLLWWPYYLVQWVVGDPSAAHGVRFFTFEHLQALYVLLRLVSCVMYAAVVLLTYVIGRRLTNPAGGLVAAILLALHPILGMTVYHLRIEPTSLMLVLLALWLLLKALDAQRYRLFLASGVCAGLAMAARFPSASAALPVLCLYCMMFPAVFPEPGQRRVNWLILWTALALLLMGGGMTLLLDKGLIRLNRLTEILLISARQGDYPHAIHLVRKAWKGLGLLAAISAVMAFTRASRRPLGKLVDSPLMPVGIGFLAGFLVGVPTLLWSGEYFLRSLNMFLERNQAGQDGLRNVWDVCLYYLYGNKYFPSAEYGVLLAPLHAWLFFGGAAALLAKRDKKLVPVLLGVGIGLLSQCGKLQSTRHITAWLPFFALVMAYPVALLAGRPFALRRPAVQFSLGALGALVVFATFHTMWSADIGTHVRIYAEKDALMPAMEQWLAANTRADDPVFMVCSEPMNGAAILNWMEMNGLRIPPGVGMDRHRFVPWFGDIQSLQRAGAGFIVISKNSYRGFYLDYYAKVAPEKLTDPYHDPHFAHRVDINPGVTNTWSIFAFDFTAEAILDQRLAEQRRRPPGLTTYLSDLQEISATCYVDSNWGFGRNGCNGCRPGGKVTVADRFSRKGLGLHALAGGKAVISYAIGDACTLLQGGVAVNDSSPGSVSPLVFTVYGDGRRLWSSTPVQQPRAPQYFEVELHGVRRLELAVECLGNNHGAHAVWIGPRLFGGRAFEAISRAGQ